ncbi:DnaA regulatory inactivator Hda [Thiorhodococcus drewsii AZ1]|uniref:DnaA regulatory inactivator Hda n=1 Tax=Thiorhodococcus drewsii AZ1 TaxID=765913 RepID=G2DZH4_9GAMM|nr:DnaA regulatory inactivator Hda [Thiorhodococcus drewsii]EGV32201.1 DnaA regulatory inactivator Hda [Thiorhodococcus drewsii AZ1]
MSNATQLAQAVAIGVNTSNQQLHLPIELRREPTLAEYLPGPNAEAVDNIAAMAAGTGEPFLFLFGNQGTGKTHLLQAACLDAAQRGLKANFVPLGTEGLGPGILENLEHSDLVAIDDIEAISGKADWERSLLDFFNQIRAQGHRLLVAARTAPDNLSLELADLSSRLQWGPRYCLAPLNDRQCEELLIRSAEHCGMRLSPDVVRFIMNNSARDPASLVTLIARLDSFSLREQRQPTIPLVRRAMEDDSKEEG